MELPPSGSALALEQLSRALQARLNQLRGNHLPQHHVSAQLEAGLLLRGEPVVARTQLGHGEPRLLAVDHVVICAGQEPERGLHDDLQALGIAARLIGGAREPAELDALRAIHEGVAVARALGTDGAAAAGAA